MVLRGVSGQSMQDLVALDGPAASNLGSCMYANAVTRNKTWRHLIGSCNGFESEPGVGSTGLGH